MTLKRDRIRARLANFDALGAFLVTGGMLLLVYTLVKAPDVDWGATRTIAELAVSAVILAAFVANKLRVTNPLVPMSILRVKGVAAADATQIVALAGFFPMFFFLSCPVLVDLAPAGVAGGPRLASVSTPSMTTSGSRWRS